MNSRALFIRLLAYSSLTGDEINLDLAKTVLVDTLRTGDRVVTIDSIQGRVADFYGLRPGELNSRSNARRITRPRQVAMFLCKELTPHSLPEIGARLWRKTPLHGHPLSKKGKNGNESDKDLQRGVNNLLGSFR